MHGKAATLKDIELQEWPAFCSGEDAPDVSANNTTPQSVDSRHRHRENKDIYKVACYCGCCERKIRIVVLCDTNTKTSLHHLLVHDLELLCPGCVNRNGF
ncbi:putative E7 [Equus asinus papillomavirus 1]|uniref:Protein E7 n=1 Tax=Equus asinus papillomavirus 1 TaxID=1163703 RepID=W5ZSB5_9PAPI|nr:putative E7 [Equus asinus papillomavirus 1]AHI45082.1 putative E7 [Equus asinus papillomavirus 1]